MHCQLCGEQKKLIEAHIIPRSFHRIASGAKDPTRMITNVPGRYTQQVPKGVYDPSVLCEGCERLFSRWDDYGAELFLHRWETFERLPDRGEVIGYRLPEYDYGLLKLFFLSVLWRAAVSSHSFFENVSLGAREPALKKSILSGDPGDKHHFGVVVQAFDNTNVGILNPDPLRMAGHRYWRLYLSHVIAFVKVDSQPFIEPFASMALCPGLPLTVAQKSYLGSPERRVMKRMVVADHQGRQAALAKRQKKN